MAKVAGSADEAKRLGFLLPTTKVVINSDRRLYVQMPLGYGKLFMNPAVNWMYATELSGRIGTL